MNEDVAKILAENLVKACALLAAGICMGIGAIGAGLSEGYAAAKACEAISRRPESYSDIFRTMLVGQAVTESTTIYAFVIAMIMIFR